MASRKPGGSFVKQTGELIDKLEDKNFFITHEANVLAMHLMAERPSMELISALKELPIYPKRPD